MVKISDLLIDGSLYVLRHLVGSWIYMTSSITYNLVRRRNAVFMTNGRKKGVNFLPFQS